MPATERTTFAEELAAEQPITFLASEPRNGLLIKPAKRHKWWIHWASRYVPTYLVHELTDGSIAYERWMDGRVAGCAV